MSRQLHALIVDDSRTTRIMVAKELQETGLATFRFTEATDGMDALAKFRPGELDLMFVDMNMPRMGGIDLVHKLHATYKDCPPAILITAEFTKERRLAALAEKGVDGFLIKPVDRDRLRDGLKAIVDSLPDRTGPSGIPHGECVPKAFRQVLSEACGVRLTPEPVDETVRSQEIVFGMLSVTGAVHWSVVAGFSRSAAAQVASNFAGLDVVQDDPELVGDAVGELTNIVGGRIRQRLADEGLEVQVSLPSVLSASEFRVLVQGRCKSATRHDHFDSPVGKMWTSVTAEMHPGLVL